MKQGISIAVIFVAMLCYNGGFAEEPATVLDDVVVSATRTDTPDDKVGGTFVTVITKEDIAAKQQTSVEEVLKDVPGVDVASTGSPGSQSSIFLRGADSKNTLILVDGVMFNDPADPQRSADLANLTTDNIERIEVIQGPMSALYGSNATGGVVNIITRKGTGVPTGSFGMEGGAYNTWKEYANSSGSIDRFNYSVSISHTDSDGFSNVDFRNPLIPHTGTNENPWRNTTFSSRAGFDINPTFEVDATLRVIDSSAGMAGWGPGYAIADANSSVKNEQYLGRLDVKNKLFDGFLRSDLDYQLSHQDQTIYDNAWNASYDYLGKSQETGWQGTFKVAKTNDLTLGTSYYQESMSSVSSGISDQTADTKSLWIGDQATFFNNLNLATALRYDDHDRFGDKVTYRIAPSYLLGSGTTLKASYGTGFMAPSLYELYAPYYGNANLKAEESQGWDVGLEQKMFGDTVSCGLTYFVMNFDNDIGFNPSTWQYEQTIGTTRTNGVESFIRYKPTKSLSLQADYTYTDSEVPAGTPSLARRPRDKFGLHGQYRIGKFGFNADMRYVGKRDTFSGSTDMYGNPVTTLDPYTVVNLGVTYQLTDRVQLYSRIDNLFNEYYEEAWSYATPGRSAYVGFKVTF